MVDGILKVCAVVGLSATAVVGLGGFYWAMVESNDSNNVRDVAEVEACSTIEDDVARLVCIDEVGS